MLMVDRTITSWFALRKVRPTSSIPSRSDLLGAHTPALEDSLLRNMADGPVPLTDVRELSRLAYGFMASKALFAALDLELFGHLAATPAELGELVEKTGIPANRLATLVAALIALGLVTEANGRLANSPAAQRYLVR